MDTPDSTTFKRCTKCGEWKSLADYCHSKASLDGRKPHCKSCNSAYQREYAKTHKEQRRANGAVWREKNRESERKRFAEYRDRNREKLRAKGRSDYRKNEEKYSAYRSTPEYKTRKSAYDKARYWADPEHSREIRRQYRIKYPERVAESDKRKRANRERRLPIERNMRAIRAGAPGKHTAEDIALQLKSQRGKCWWCGRKIVGRYHVDHRVPLARGGSNDPGNLVISCPECNQSKHAKFPHEWNGRLL